MKKLLNNLKVLVVILLVILLSIIAFWGVFGKDKAVWKNQVPSYKYGMDILGARELRFSVDTSEEQKYVYVDENNNIMGEVLKDGSAVTEEDEKSSEQEQATAETPENATETTENTEEKKEDEEVPYSKQTKTIKANSDEQLNKENFEAAKKTIQKRLDKQGIADYNIRIDDVTGKLIIETENDEDNVSKVENLVEQVGKFEIVDYQNGLRLMDNSDVKNASVVTSTEDSTYKTYLKIELNKDGAQKLKDMSNKYVEEKKDESESEENNESEDTSEEKNIKYVTVKFDGTTLMTTYFAEEMTGGTIYINVGQARDSREEALKDRDSAQTIADVLNLKKLPVKYSLETDNFVKSEINIDCKLVATICVIAVAIISLIFIVKYKKEGALAAILGLGYIALLSIAIRYVGDVDLTLNSIAAAIAVIAMNYIFEWVLLSKQKAFGATMKIFWTCSIPVIISTLVFTFNTALKINSMGMVMFWGLLIIAIYNLLLTRAILKK